MRLDDINLLFQCYNNVKECPASIALQINDPPYKGGSVR